MEKEIEKFFRKGDKVVLVSTEKCEELEFRNWIEWERSNPKAGQIFTVDYVEVDELGSWVNLYELDYAHPLSKFEFVSKSISDMADQKLSTIDTFQNKNRGFKEDEREIPLENINHEDI